MFIATIGYGIGLDASFFRIIAAMMLIGIGVILLVPQLQTQVAAAAAPISGWTEDRFGGIETGGLSGQFALGLLLGAVWSPCVGPTLGAASVLAAQGENLGQVALVMLAFGLGAALPLLLLGPPVARYADALARTAAGSRQGRQARARRPARRHRIVDRHRPRQAP